MWFPDISRFSTLFGLGLNNDILTLFTCIIQANFVRGCALPYCYKCGADQLKKNAKKLRFLLAYCFLVYICLSNQQLKAMEKETKQQLTNLAACILTTLALIAFCIINLFLFNQ